MCTHQYQKKFTGPVRHSALPSKGTRFPFLCCKTNSLLHQPRTMSDKRWASQGGFYSRKKHFPMQAAGCSCMNHSFLCLYWNKTEPVKNSSDILNNKNMQIKQWNRKKKQTITSFLAQLYRWNTLQPPAVSPYCKTTWHLSGNLECWSALKWLTPTQSTWSL